MTLIHTRTSTHPPTTTQVHALPDADGTVRLFRAGGVLAAAANPKAAHGPVWHSSTAEDSHVWTLEFQLGPDAGKALRDWLRPVTPAGAAAAAAAAAAAPKAAQVPPAARPPRPTTPLAVALLFGHRRYPLPHEARPGPAGLASDKQQQAATADDDDDDPWAPALDGAAGGSRPSSLSKRGSRGRKASLDRLFGLGAAKWGGGEGEEGKAGEDYGMDGQNSSYHSVRDGASSLASGSSVGSFDGSERDGVCCWVRTGELSSDDGEGGEDDDLLLDAASTQFRDVGLNEGGVHGA